MADARLHGQAALRGSTYRALGMVTHWFTDVPVPATDRTLVRALIECSRWLENEEPACRIGLLRDDGRVYRVIIAYGEPQRMAIEATVVQFGYAVTATPAEFAGRLHVTFGPVTCAAGLSRRKDGARPSSPDTSVFGTSDPP